MNGFAGSPAWTLVPGQAKIGLRIGTLSDRRLHTVGDMLGFLSAGFPLPDDRGGSLSATAMCVSEVAQLTEMVSPFCARPCHSVAESRLRLGGSAEVVRTRLGRARTAVQRSAATRTSKTGAIDSGARGIWVAGRRPAASAQVLRPLARCLVHLRTARGSRMTGDCHARFCESQGVRVSSATYLKGGWGFVLAVRAAPPLTINGLQEEAEPGALQFWFAAAGQATRSTD